MNHSDSIAAISAALAKAQGQLEGAKKDSKNPHFKSSYADLASVWDACRDALSSNQIAVIQAPGAVASGVVEITTILAHSSGEWFRETLTVPLAKVDAQGLGSAVTYGRRYALAAMVGVAPEDDDGNAAVASRGAANDRPRNGNGHGNVGTVNDEQLVHLQGLASQVGADLQRFCDYFKVASLRDIPAARFDEAVSALNAKMKKAA